MKIWQHWQNRIRHDFKHDFKQGFKHYFKQGINLLIPPQCPGCHAIVHDDGLCGQCWSRIKRITPPLCIQCGRGFPYAAGIERCVRCLTQPPDFDRAITGFGYNAMSQRLILGLKYAKRHDVTPAIARMMANAGGECLQEADWIIPLPLHWTRYYQRGFNQSAELAHAIIKAAHIPADKYRPDLLKRIKKTESQGHKNRQQRQRNMQGAFQVTDPANCIKNASVLIIDDVLTTGASLSSAARCLKIAGAKHVTVLLAARVG